MAQIAHAGALRRRRDLAQYPHRVAPIGVALAHGPAQPGNTPAIMFAVIGKVARRPVGPAFDHFKPAPFRHRLHPVAIPAPAILRVSVFGAARRRDMHHQPAHFKNPRHFQESQPEEFVMLQHLARDHRIVSVSLDAEFPRVLQHDIDIRPGLQVQPVIFPAAFAFPDAAKPRPFANRAHIQHPALFQHACMAGKGLAHVKPGLLVHCSNPCSFVLTRHDCAWTPGAASAFCAPDRLPAPRFAIDG